MNLTQWNGKKTIRLFSVIGAVCGLITLAASVTGGLLAFQSFRCLKNARRTMAKIDKAATLYIQNTEKEPEDSEDLPF